MSTTAEQMKRRTLYDTKRCVEQGNTNYYLPGSERIVRTDTKRKRLTPRIVSENE